MWKTKKLLVSKRREREGGALVGFKQTNDVLALRVIEFLSIEVNASQYGNATAM